MRKLLIALFIVVGLLTSMSTVRAAEEESPYPTITLIFSDGGVYNISGKFWAGTIIPYIQGRINGYNWETDARSKYIFFDKEDREIGVHIFSLINEDRTVLLKDWEEIYEDIINLPNKVLKKREYIESNTQKEL